MDIEKSKKHKTYNEFYSILSAIKRCFSRSPIHRSVLNAAKVNEKGPRGGARYKCSQCGQHFGQKEIQVDHKDPIVPIGTASKDMSWDELVARTFCSTDNLWTLCVSCHKKKSKQELKERKTTCKS